FVTNLNLSERITGFTIPSMRSVKLTFKNRRNTMKNKKRLLIPTLLFLVLGAVTLSACNHPQSPEEKAEWVMHKIATTLELRQDQIVKLNDVKDEIMKHKKLHQTKKAEFMDGLMVEIEKPTIDRNFFINLIDQHKTNLDTLAPPIIDKIIIFHESLTVEQKTNVVKIMKKFKKMHNKSVS
ncbi:MAG: hypothetical protein ACC653_10110, partial [Gammaproteobacteria bacterium]